MIEVSTHEFGAALTSSELAANVTCRELAASYIPKSSDTVAEWRNGRRGVFKALVGSGSFRRASLLATLFNRISLAGPISTEIVGQIEDLHVGKAHLAQLGVGGNIEPSPSCSRLLCAVPGASLVQQEEEIAGRFRYRKSAFTSVHAVHEVPWKRRLFEPVPASASPSASVQADYLVATFDNGTNNHQNNLRVGAGVVLHF